jgi:hypothetical protein
VAHGTPWKLVATGEEVPGALALRWDKESEPRVESLAAKSGLLVAWHSFGKFEPDDDVIFGVAPAEAVAVTQVPGYGLPETEVDVIDVPGANWHAFVFASYAAIGVVTAGDAKGMKTGEVLLVPQDCWQMLDTVEAFLAARVAGEGADAFLSPKAETGFGHQGAAPLYAGENGGRYINSSVLFIEPTVDGESCEAGVRLETVGGNVAEDTLVVYRYSAAGTRIAVSRSGVTGP